MPAPTLRDVAEAAGVHPATASRALNPADPRRWSTPTRRAGCMQGRRVAGLPAEPDRPQPQDRRVRHRRAGHPRPHQPAVPADRARHRGRAEPRRLQRPDRQHRQRPGPRAGADRVAALPPGRGAASSRPRGSSTRCWRGCTPRACGWCWSTAAPTASTSRRSPPTTRPASSWRSRTWPGSGHRRIAHLAGPQNTSTGVVRRPRVPRTRCATTASPTTPTWSPTSAYWTEDGRARRRCGELLDAGVEFTAVVARQRPARARLLRRVPRARDALPRRHQRGRASTTCRSSTSCGRR